MCPTVHMLIVPTPPPTRCLQEPWGGCNSFQIMVALQDGGRPDMPPASELPSELGSPAAVADYVRLIHQCWDE